PENCDATAKTARSTSATAFWEHPPNEWRRSVHRCMVFEDVARCAHHRETLRRGGGASSRTEKKTFCAGQHWTTDGGNIAPEQYASSRGGALHRKRWPPTPREAYKSNRLRSQLSLGGVDRHR